MAQSVPLLHSGACAHILKNKVTAATLPNVKFGANAACFRLNVLTYNLLTALKRLTLPGDLATARPKRLRFLLFNNVDASRSAHAPTSHGHSTLALMRAVRQRIMQLAPALAKN